MKSSYDILGNHIRIVDYRNRDFVSDKVLGINIDKYFMPSVANVIGTDLSKYKLISKGLFACNPMHVGRDERLPVALYTDDTPAIVSPAYFMFEVIDNTKLNEEFLMMWFRRPEFDRICWLKTDGSVRGGITWDDICRIELPVPPFEEQLKIVSSYKAITDRIALKQRINDNLAETEQVFLKKTTSTEDTSLISLGDIVEFIDGDRGKNYPTYDEFAKEGYCLFLNASNVTGIGFDFSDCMFITKEKDELMNKGHLERFDIVLTSRGTLGNVAFYNNHIPYENVRINSGMLIIRSKSDKIKSYYLYALLKSSYMKSAIEQYRSGSAQPQLPIKDLQKISLNIPNSESVLEKINADFRRIENIISQNGNEISNLKALQSVLLSELSR